MKMRFSICLLALGLLGIIPASGQDCTDYHKYHCLYGDYTFYYSRQSKSALFKSGQTKELRITAYSGEDYYVAVCANHKFGDIRYRILEDTPERSLVYDNATDKYAESIIFSNDLTRNLVIEVSVPEADARREDEFRCVGVVIEYRKTESD
ncbi:MAG: hypothetical protein JW801_12700 [Bacteroidales bacterium]|nr:hypothetical protein [Bacteroidales bacterium]